MTPTYEFLIARADDAAREATTALLENVKQRALRSEAAWREMAVRAQKMAAEREKARVLRESAARAVPADAAESRRVDNW